MRAKIRSIRVHRAHARSDDGPCVFVPNKNISFADATRNAYGPVCNTQVKYAVPFLGAISEIAQTVRKSYATLRLSEIVTLLK